MNARCYYRFYRLWFKNRKLLLRYLAGQYGLPPGKGLQGQDPRVRRMIQNYPMTQANYTCYARSRSGQNVASRSSRQYSIGEKHKKSGVLLRVKRLSIRDGFVSCPPMWEKVHVLLHLPEDNRRYDVLKKPANSICIKYQASYWHIAVTSNRLFHYFGTTQL